MLATFGASPGRAVGDRAQADPRGRTPLHLAASFSSKEICGCLLEHGSDVGAEDFLGLTAADCAEERGRARDVLEFLNQFQSELERRQHKMRLAEKRNDPKFLSILEMAKASGLRPETTTTTTRPPTVDALAAATSSTGYARTDQNDADLVAALQKLDFKEKAFGADYYGLLPTLSRVAAAYRARGDLLGARSALERSARISADAYVGRAEILPVGPGFCYGLEEDGTSSPTRCKSQQQRCSYGRGTGRRLAGTA